MATKYHITAAGDPAPCTATKRACPVGGEHFESEASARSSYEARMELNGRIETAIHHLGSLADDLEGSVPDPQNYRAEAEFLLSMDEGEESYEEMVEVAQEWARNGDAYEMLVGSSFLSSAGIKEERGSR